MTRHRLEQELRQAKFGAGVSVVAVVFAGVGVAAGSAVTVGVAMALSALAALTTVKSLGFGTETKK